MKMAIRPDASAAGIQNGRHKVMKRFGCELLLFISQQVWHITSLPVIIRLVHFVPAALTPVRD